MARFRVARLLAFVLMPPSATAVQGQRLLEIEGIELRGTARVVAYGASTCHVNEDRETPASYEQRKANDGQPIDIWQLDFSVYNGSGRPLDHLIALYGIKAEDLPCTTWDPVSFGGHVVDWSVSAGHIQRSGSGDPTAPGETLTATEYIYAFHEHRPRFDTWSVDYHFAAATSADSGPRRTLASSLTAAETCAGKPAGSQCWMELANRPGCYVWNPRLMAGETATWSGACSRGYIEGTGEVSWRYDAGEQTWSGPFAGGKSNGHLVGRDADGNAWEGAYANGVRNGNWVFRHAGEGVVEAEGAYVNGKRSGNWTFRHASGTVSRGPYVDGKRHGQWLTCSYASDDPFDDGEILVYTTQHSDGREEIFISLDPDPDLVARCRSLLRQF